jgi:putative DNA primase/helicase
MAEREAEITDPFTEDALALRFSERHKDDLRYLAPKTQWFHWDGQRWRPELTLLAYALARESCRLDAAEFGNGKPPKCAFDASTFAAVERLARADRKHATAIEQWDADPWIITAEDATYDLRTGIGRPHDPSHYITKKLACPAAPPGTPHPQWTQFLDRITDNNAELQQFLQRYMGYCLTGDTSEHRFAFGHGSGRNGKGTFLNTMEAIFGDYATIGDVGTFIASNHERHPTDVAKLHGYRLVVAQETQRGRQWDEAKIKTMTGGDKMTARFMRQDFFDFKPSFKLFITGNHKPNLETVDEAMRRRLLLVPFNVQIPEAEQDIKLQDKLKAEWPAILRWAIDGCLEWQRIGLSPPKVVTEATAEYFGEQDVIQQWMDERTLKAPPTVLTRSSELYSCWKNWCDEGGIKPGSNKALSEALKARGFAKGRDGSGNPGFKGLDIRR